MRASAGKTSGQTAASAIVRTPPATTAGTAPTSAAAAPADGPLRERDAGEQGADGGRAAEQAEPGRPRVQHGAGEERQQGDCAAEEDGEEVERDRAEQDRRLANQVQPAEHVRDRRR